MYIGVKFELKYCIFWYYHASIFLNALLLEGMADKNFQLCCKDYWIITDRFTFLDVTRHISNHYLTIIIILKII
jgi:hypothetical protein